MWRTDPPEQQPFEPLWVGGPRANLVRMRFSIDIKKLRNALLL